ncbi:MAG: hypothetical protein U0Y10_04415 [Spirosomataceae bacterium]
MPYQLKYLVADERIGQLHQSLMLAILAEGTQTFAPDMKQLQKQSKIGNRNNFYKCLNDLHRFGYINYRQGTRYSESQIALSIKFGTLTNVQGIKIDTPTEMLSSNGDTQDNSLSIKNDVFNHVKSDTQIPVELSKVIRINEKQRIDSQSTKSSFLKMKDSKNTPTLPHSIITHNQENTISNNQPPIQEGSQETKKSKRILGNNATDHPFAESALFDRQTFKDTFAESEKWKQIDFDYYYEKVLNWRDTKSGLPPKRTDWKATIIQFFLNDYQKDRLVIQKEYATGPKHPTLKPLGLAPHPQNGREFGKW